MTADIKGLEKWEGETREWSRKAGKLKMKAGVGLIDALENWYAAYQVKATPRNQREYLTWRLRLHLRWNDDVEFLQELDDVFEIGLTDEEVGKTLWDITPEKSSGFTTGFNWRRDSGNALKGGRRGQVEESPQEDLEE